MFTYPTSSSATANALRIVMDSMASKGYSEHTSSIIQG